MLRPDHGRRFVFRSGVTKCLCESLKSKSVRSALKLHGVGSRGRLRAPVGSRGKKPLETPGFNSIFNAKYCLNLFSFNTFLSMFTYRKKVTWATPLWGPKGKAHWSSKGLQHFQFKILSKFVLFFFITHSSYKCLPIEKKTKTKNKTKEGVITWTILAHVKSGGPGGKAPGSLRGLQHIQCKMSSKFVVF